MKKLHILAVLFLLLSTTTIYAQQPASYYGMGLNYISPQDYANLPRPDWEEIKKYAIKSNFLQRGPNGITMLQTPPIGDQQTQGSCVGWAVGYTAMSILSFPHFCSWNNALRSPAYIYNQISDHSDCRNSGSLITDALNLVQNQGDCSWNLMPYNVNDCNTQPNASQAINANLNKAIRWAALNITDVDGIKNALDLGLPVVIGQRVTHEFDNMWNSNGVWNINNINNYRGKHATCIIGYDDNTQMFRVQNQWGLGGDNGFYWVTYNLVRSNCLEQVFIVYGTNQDPPQTIDGNDVFCNTSTSFSVTNLPAGSNVTWSLTPPTGVATLSCTNCQTATITKVANGSVAISAVYQNPCISISTPIIVTKQIAVGPPILQANPPSSFISYNALIAPFNPSANPAGGVDACTNQYITSNLNLPYGSTSAWTFISGTGGFGPNSPINTNTRQLSFSFWNPNQTAKFKLTLNNACGTNVTYYDFAAHSCYKTSPCSQYRITPSVTASQSASISHILLRPAPCGSSTATKTISSVAVINKDGDIVKQNNEINTAETNVGFGDLTDGSYLLKITTSEGDEEMHPFIYTALGSNEQSIAEQIADGSLLINKSHADERLYVMQEQLYENLQNNDPMLINSGVLTNFVTQNGGSSFDFIYQINRFIDNAQYEEATAFLDQWHTQNQVDDNYYQYFRLYIKYIHDNSLSPEDMIILGNLAQLCPLVSGNIIFSAQSLYNSLAIDALDFSDVCSGYLTRGVKTKIPKLITRSNKASNIIIYPNPAKDNFTIVLPANNKGSNIVKVYNNIGKVVLEQNINSKVENITFNKILGSGIYTVNITNINTSKTETQKLIINN